ncbi:Ribosome assembly protein 1; AltName: Full=EF-2 like GTPase; AltName: Full=Elongation factor-like 1 [Serendipita indica DSM 11827]|uniref:Ribosome assembly protein 1 n=1 Tax=Serendipita indica (strain DSM 11827) TaxID=1109443 RepID=G4TMJ4_SERID|nr:Ribosome assembly protein 1; AltName: Full=EF-2 like GTPase; AltName: Full=Elongation factor-like 1 [Serendipita indica DSM 11827]CCA72528.1 related to translation elongation factor 2-putative [Serendipita indica DSM 11827]
MSGNATFSRNITASGHVDHGKTTYLDSLLAANNIISTRQAGKIRYLDSREDEQERGITMEASAVSLRFTSGASAGSSGTATPVGESSTVYTINLIDTPGHIDFSSEVSAASRLCDGTLVLVDVVEGVCTQTVSVLRQARADRLKPILILNKFDRLITELQMSPTEAYHHLCQLIEQVNAVMGSFFASERLEDDLRWREERERRLESRRQAIANLDQPTDVDQAVFDEFKEKDDEDIYFAPDRGNVIFASAIDGWAFRIGKFARLYSNKLGFNEETLKKVLWGDYYLDPKTKRVISQRHLKGRNLKPLFVQLVLENIWNVYENVITNPNPEKVTKIIGALNLRILPRDINSKNPRHLLNLIFSQWLPLASCTIQAVIDIVPPPTIAQETRLPKIVYPDLSEETKEPKNKLERGLWACDSQEDSYVIAYVSKMFAVQRKDMPESKRAPGSRNAESKEDEDATPTIEADENDEVLLGFSRLYSGRLRTGSTVAVILPKYQHARGVSSPRNSRFISFIKIKALYTMMGRDLVPISEVVAGNVFAVAGLGGFVGRSATICSPSSIGFDENMAIQDLESKPEAECIINLGGLGLQISPIVRVAVEPVESADMSKMVEGLKILSQSDPCVEVFQQQTGEWVILCAGELHLERCLKDLRERFAKVEIQASNPIVPFRETAVKAPDMAPPKTANAPRGTVHGSASHSLATFTVRAVPMPDALTEYLQQNHSIIARLEREMHDRVNGVQQQDSRDEDTEEELAIAHGELFHKPTVKPEDFWTTFTDIAKKAGGEWAKRASHVWAFGPNRTGPNLLLDCRPEGERWHDRMTCSRNDPPPHISRSSLEYEPSLEAGFQIATLQGPMCAEPVQGMAYIVESLQSTEPEKQDQDAHSKRAQAKGSLISGMRDACRKGLLDWSPRLLLAMYSCDIQAATEVLGKVYSVVGRRKGRIVAEEMKEGTTYITVSSVIPVVESFGFSDEIRKKTSGAANPQLIFSGYERLDLDPFWVPTTEEELEDLGEKADRANVARGYMEAVRERKGMFVEKKLVQFAEKQRTLKR